MKHLTISITAALLLTIGVFTGCGGSSDPSIDQSNNLQTIAQALLGSLSEADYKITTPLGSVLAEGKTTKGDGVDVDTAGLIQVTQATVDTLKSTTIFVIEVIGGKDIDANDDKIWDENPIDVNGSIHVIVDNAVPEDTGKINITVLSEIVYQSVIDSIKEYTPVQLKDELKKRAEKLFKNDINKDGMIDNKDTMGYSPVKYKEMLNDDTRKIADAVLGDIHAGGDLKYSGNFFTYKLKEKSNGNNKAIYTYDNHGNLKVVYETLDLPEGIIKTETTYHFDNKDKLSYKTLVFTQRGSNIQFIDTNTSYIYDEDGNLITENIDKLQDNTIDNRIEYTYDINGSVLRKTEGSIDSLEEFEIFKMTQWTYVDNGKADTKIIDFNGDGIFDNYIKYYYTTDGQIHEESIDIDGDSIEDDYIDYKYDQNNNLYQKQWLKNYFNHPGDSSSQRELYITKQSEYEYDKHHNKIRKSSIIFPEGTLYNDDEVISPIYTDIETYMWGF